MDITTILAQWNFGRSRLLGILDTIEKSGQDLPTVFGWRPGQGRAHIAWQAAHCAATHDRYVNVLLKGVAPMDPKLVADFGGGSTPSDANVPSLAEIRSLLTRTYENALAYINALDATDLEKKVTLPNGSTRGVGESLLLLPWHEAHHQGQIHLTWNLYQAAHGMK